MCAPALATEFARENLTSSTTMTSSTVTTSVEPSKQNLMNVGLQTPEEDREKVIRRRNSTTTYTHTITCPAVLSSMKTQVLTEEQMGLMKELELKHPESALTIQEMEYQASQPDQQ